MATTTNYGWTTPNDTDLVKDGASAIRTLGSSIDTTTKALNPSTTLGDIEYRSATANTNTRLGIGTSGQVLTVNGSGVPAWSTISAGGMTLLSTTTLSGATTAINSISQSYTDLVVLILGQTNATANGQLKVWARNGTTNLACRLTFTDDSVWSERQDIVMNAAADDGSRLERANGANGFQIRFSNYSSTTGYKPFVYSGEYEDANNVPSATFAGGGVRSTSAIDSILLQNSGGNFSGGTVLIYGVK